MKKNLSIAVLVAVMALTQLFALSACGGGPVSITVVSVYDASDGNHENFVNAYTAYETATGNTVIDKSAKSTEAWKTGVRNDFKNGAEPDVLFYFTGADAKDFIDANKVVPLADIRNADPSYAANMKESMLPVGPDGRKYAVPVNGYWEGLFVNKKVLAACGIAVPSGDYTWAQFLADCQTIKDAGYTPIAGSLKEVPHYWFEFCTLNNGNLENHLSLPKAADDAADIKWAKGLEDIKDLYEKGFFPDNTLTAGDAETCRMILENQAAFLIDGSWKVGYFQTVQKIKEASDRSLFADTMQELKIEDMDFTAYSLDNYAISYVPAKGDREATQMIGGLSMGYYITQKAWKNPAKRTACIEFVKAMTTDEVVSLFGSVSVTALKSGTYEPASADALVKSAIAMNKGCTGIVAAVQDLIEQGKRIVFLGEIKDVVTGEVSAQNAIKKCFDFT